MAYWLVKSEPFKYSWDQFVAEKQTMWNGVRNYAARNNLRAMQKGDEVFFYHSNEGLEIVGIAKVVKEHYPDPTADNDTWSVVDLKPVKKLKQPVTLANIKANKQLANMQMIKLNRLSVTAVTPDEWEVIMELGGMNA
jgi:predicted RNA-binding protein with PUA-like domain